MGLSLERLPSVFYFEILVYHRQTSSNNPFSGEALGALGAPDVRTILEEFKNDPVTEVAETCTLALDRLTWLEKYTEDGQSKNPYKSVDPTPPSEETDVCKLREALLNEEESLFNRYRAMFALRNLRTNEAVLALTDGTHSSSHCYTPRLKVK